MTVLAMILFFLGVPALLILLYLLDDPYGKWRRPRNGL